MKAPSWRRGPSVGKAPVTWAEVSCWAREPASWSQHWLEGFHQRKGGCHACRRVNHVGKRLLRGLKGLFGQPPVWSTRKRERIWDRPPAMPRCSCSSTAPLQALLLYQGNVRKGWSHSRAVHCFRKAALRGVLRARICQVFNWCEPLWQTAEKWQWVGQLQPCTSGGVAVLWQLILPGDAPGQAVLASCSQSPSEPPSTNRSLSNACVHLLWTRQNDKVQQRA